MKRVIYLVCLLIANASQAAIPMSRVVAINDSRTIVVETNGVQSTIIMKGVDISPGEEILATEHLHKLLDRAWVYVEDGNVYRSPDGLYVNAELQRHAWRAAPGMRYLGEVNPGALTRRSAAPSPTSGRGISRYYPRPTTRGEGGPKGRWRGVRRRPRSSRGA